MEIWLGVAKAVMIVIGVFSAPLMLWLLITGIRGFGKPKELVKEEEKQYRFAILICARNEESVIGNLLKSLQKQDYDGAYQVFVVADNCTDNTALMAEKNGAIVFKRFDEKNRGKGFAMHFGVNRIQSAYQDSYDAICVFDADNLASASFLTEMNNALCSGADVALGYRDTKNIHDSWISEAYCIYCLMIQRFYHNPRHAMGISSMVGGTGFAFKTSSLDKSGWSTASITEDVEFSIQQVLAGHKIVPATKARFFDEQPREFGVSVKQRLRWMTGGIQCIPLYLKKIFNAAFYDKNEKSEKNEKKSNLKVLDLAWYVLFIPANGLTIPLNIASVMCLIFSPEWMPLAPLMIIGGLLMSVLVTWVVAFATLKLEKRQMKGMGRAIILYPIFMVTSMVVALVALFRPSTEWVPIKHSSSRSIEELE